MIDRKAMEHIQPSSFADLLALLPGGSSSSPVLSAPNTIHLREIGISNDDYATSSLGTSFVIDGAPMRNDANMQYLPGGDQLLERKLFINKGVDMRSISTDEIQHVEIVRGIPSVEYGDLTSGLVKIERKRGGKALTAVSRRIWTVNSSPSARVSKFPTAASRSISALTCSTPRPTRATNSKTTSA